MGNGSRLCIGLSIIYFMISTGNLKRLARIIENLERKFIMRRRKREPSLRRKDFISPMQDAKNKKTLELKLNSATN
uniref:Uncharacterized protein n=1 Tax=Solanum lycopersicum TaxID=4081 RepID=A0A3Q7IHF5_SOLLC